MKTNPQQRRHVRLQHITRSIERTSIGNKEEDDEKEQEEEDDDEKEEEVEEMEYEVKREARKELRGFIIVVVVVEHTVVGRSVAVVPFHRLRLR